VTYHRGATNQRHHGVTESAGIRRTRPPPLIRNRRSRQVRRGPALHPRMKPPVADELCPTGDRRSAMNGWSPCTAPSRSSALPRSASTTSDGRGTVGHGGRGRVSGASGASNGRRTPTRPRLWARGRRRGTVGPYGRLADAPPALDPEGAAAVTVART
jgi:hypothetical protein